jgi:two-component system chemotaxis response regulator CheB
MGKEKSSMKFSEVQRELIFEVAHQLTGSSRSFRGEVIIHNVAARMRSVGVLSLTDYFEYALANSGELHELISAMTIHTTQWFRDPTQLSEVEVQLEERIKSSPTHSELRILSAGCSSGQEVYSLALICERIRTRTRDRSFDFEIVGCDIDPVNLQIARIGQYENHPSTQAFTDLDMKWIDANLASNGTLDRGGIERVNCVGGNEIRTLLSFAIAAALRRKTSFKTSNLLKTDDYLIGQFDLCVCRNVLIYFDPTGVQTILENLVKYLKPEGLLVLGAGESVSLPFSGSSRLGHGIFKVAEESGSDLSSAAFRPLSSNTAGVFGTEQSFAAGTRTIKIVAVDDDREMLEVYKEYCAAMTLSNVDLRTFTDPNSAIQYIKSAHASIDFVFVDFEMPRMNGSQFLVELRGIDAHIPCVLVSGHGGRSTFAKASGFEDMLAKPVDIDSFEKCIQMFAGKHQKRSPIKSNNIPNAILIGASTGGPPLLESLLRNISPVTPPIVLVQHLSADFSTSFARQLRDASGLALGNSDGVTPLRLGNLYVSFADEHLKVAARNGQLVAKTEGRIPVHGQCPAVDPLFESAAALEGKFHFWAGLFTGMGRDGGMGLLRLKQAGAWTFAQNEESSVIYGMPKFAKELGAACAEGTPQDFRARLESLPRGLPKAKAG